MKFLFIDTTSNYLTVSIGCENKIEFLYHDYIENDLSSKLIPIVESGFNKCGFELKEIDKLFVVNGPGSFTGIRVGVTAVKVMAWALNKKVIPISSLEFMATTDTKNNKKICMIDARRGNVYAGVYDDDLNVILKDKLVNKQEFLNNFDINIDTITNDTELITNSIKPKYDVLKIVSKHINESGINPHNLSPNYLKLTEAEENKLRNDKKF